MTKHLHFQFQGNFEKLIADWSNAGFTVILTSGFRTYEAQAALYKADKRNAPPGGSHHNFGLAIDVNLKRGNRQLMKATAKQTWIDSGAIDIAESNGFRWGGNFSGYADNVHFYINIPIKDLQAMTGYAANMKRLNQLKIA